MSKEQNAYIDLDTAIAAKEAGCRMKTSKYFRVNFDGSVMEQNLGSFEDYNHMRHMIARYTERRLNQWVKENNIELKIRKNE